MQRSLSCTYAQGSHHGVMFHRKTTRVYLFLKGRALHGRVVLQLEKTRVGVGGVSRKPSLTPSSKTRPGCSYPAVAALVILRVTGGILAVPASAPKGGAGSRANGFQEHSF